MKSLFWPAFCLPLFIMCVFSQAEAGNFGSLEGYWQCVEDFPGGYKQPVIMTIKEDIIRFNSRREIHGDVKNNGNYYIFMRDELMPLGKDAANFLYEKFECNGRDSMIYDFPVDGDKRTRKSFKRISSENAKEILKNQQ